MINSILETYKETWVKLKEYDESVDVDYYHFNDYPYNILPDNNVIEDLDVFISKSLHYVEVMKDYLNENDTMFGIIREDNKDKFKSALELAHFTIMGEYVHTSIMYRAAVLYRNLIQGHFFVDGNKRISTMLVLLYLKKHQDFLLNELESVLSPSIMLELAVAFTADIFNEDHKVEKCANTFNYFLMI